MLLDDAGTASFTKIDPEEIPRCRAQSKSRPTTSTARCSQLVTSCFDIWASKLVWLCSVIDRPKAKCKNEANLTLGRELTGIALPAAVPDREERHSPPDRHQTTPRDSYTMVKTHCNRRGGVGCVRTPRI